MTNEPNFPRVAVLGAGTMGHGIAQVCAASGREVALYDVTPELAAKGLANIRASLDKAVELKKVDAAARDRTLAKIRASDDLADAVRGTSLVIEAVPEKLALKTEVFGRWHRSPPPTRCSPRIPPRSRSTRSPASLPRPGEFIGLHFFNPVPRMKLLEIIRGAKTSDETIARARPSPSRSARLQLW